MTLGTSLKTTALLAVLTALVVFIGFLISGTPEGALPFLILAGIMNVATYFFSDKIVLKVHGVQLIDPADNPDLHSLVDTLARENNLPKPRIGIYQSPTPNAFATGRNPKHGVVAVSTSLLQMMNYDELEGILAHELSHIKNRDTLVSVIASVMAGAITWMAWSLLWGRNQRNQAASLLVFLIAPIAASIIQMAVSRTREYKADASAAHMTHKPDALASALLKLQRGVKARPAQGNDSFENLYIINPFGGGLLHKIFSTHPPVEERVQRLRNMETR